LHDLVFIASLLSYGLKEVGIVVVVVWSNRPTPGVLTCRRHVVALAPFFHLGGGDPDVGEESARRRGVI
jgi:hypothetical protein